jgi:hypothetical protein
MAQYTPSAVKPPTGALPDDGDLQPALPRICVDYLSHQWAEEDVWRSWRNMTRHKHQISNGLRLENASWRTWWKQRNKLKTVSPETLNWSVLLLSGRCPPPHCLRFLARFCCLFLRLPLFKCGLCLVDGPQRARYRMDGSRRMFVSSSSRLLGPPRRGPRL